VDEKRMSISLVLPFEYTIPNLPTVDSVPAQQTNYTLLDRFALKTKIRSVLQDMYGPVDILYRAEEIEGRMRLFLQTDPHVIKAEDVKNLEAIIADMVKEENNLIELLDFSRNVQTSKAFIPSWYISSIVPRMNLPMTFYDGNFLYLDVSDYISLPDDAVFDTDDAFTPDYLEKVSLYQVEIIKALEELWLSGYLLGSGLEEIVLPSGIPMDADAFHIEEPITKRTLVIPSRHRPIKLI
jgi:hypothetical protein